MDVGTIFQFPALIVFLFYFFCSFSALVLCSIQIGLFLIVLSFIRFAHGNLFHYDIERMRVYCAGCADEIACSFVAFDLYVKEISCSVWLASERRWTSGNCKVSSQYISMYLLYTLTKICISTVGIFAVRPFDVDFYAISL